MLLSLSDNFHFVAYKSNFLEAKGLLLTLFCLTTKGQTTQRFAEKLRAAYFSETKIKT